MQIGQMLPGSVVSALRNSAPSNPDREKRNARRREKRVIANTLKSIPRCDLNAAPELRIDVIVHRHRKAKRVEASYTMLEPTAESFLSRVVTFYSASQKHFVNVPLGRGFRDAANTARVKIEKFYSSRTGITTVILVEKASLVTKRKPRYRAVNSGECNTDSFDIPVLPARTWQGKDGKYSVNPVKTDDNFMTSYL